MIPRGIRYLKRKGFCGLVMKLLYIMCPYFLQLGISKLLFSVWDVDQHPICLSNFRQNDGFSKNTYVNLISVD